MNRISLFLRSLVAVGSLLLLASAIPSVAQETETGNSNAGDIEMTVSQLPELPVGLTSFGGAVCNGHLYVYGGHCGEAHEYYQSGQNGVLYRLDLKQPKDWEKVNETTGRQGLAMVSHDGKLYRLGGFEARNQQGEEHDLHSIATFEQFDPKTGEWTELTPMPEPRSSFDAAVVGDTLYVVGGWAMAGDEETRWSETAWSYDLSRPDGEWQRLPDPPFQRRAMSVSFQGDQLYVIGGMQKQGGPTRKVAVYDIANKTWSEGPELPGDEGMEGFGNSSFNVGGTLCVSTYGGNLHRLSDKGKTWKPIGTVGIGRFFHRLLPVSDNEFVLVGGANMEYGKTLDVEVIRFENED